MFKISSLRKIFLFLYKVDYNKFHYYVNFHLESKFLRFLKKFLLFGIDSIYLTGELLLSATEQQVN